MVKRYYVTPRPRSGSIQRTSALKRPRLKYLSVYKYVSDVPAKFYVCAFRPNLNKKHYFFGMYTHAQLNQQCSFLAKAF